MENRTEFDDKHDSSKWLIDRYDKRVITLKKKVCPQWSKFKFIEVMDFSADTNTGT